VHAVHLTLARTARMRRHWPVAVIVGALAMTGTVNAADSVLKLEWEVIEKSCPAGYLATGFNDCTYSERLKVPGGWLVRTTHVVREQASHFVPPFPGGSGGNYTTGGGMGLGSGLTFLPDPGHTWQVR
jgi:hypothetical protein